LAIAAAMIDQTKKLIRRRMVVIAVALAAAWFPSGADCAQGDLYETDLGSGSVLRFTPDGTQSSFASGFIAPVGLTFDGKGNTFIGDAGGGAIIKVSPDGTQASSPPSRKALRASPSTARGISSRRSLTVVLS
jgi:hypothetical protein